MILQVIIAICCFAEMISPKAILPNDKKRDIARFNRSLTHLCGPIKESNKECGRIPIIKLLNTNQSRSQMCSGYKHEFGKVSCALKNITSNHCNNNGTIERLWEIADDLSGSSRNETCDGNKSFMWKFCFEVNEYINIFQDKCV